MSRNFPFILHENCCSTISFNTINAVQLSTRWDYKWINTLSLSFWFNRNTNELSWFYISFITFSLSLNVKYMSNTIIPGIQRFEITGIPWRLIETWFGEISAWMRLNGYLSDCARSSLKSWQSFRFELNCDFDIDIVSMLEFGIWRWSRLRNITIDLRCKNSVPVRCHLLSCLRHSTRFARVRYRSRAQVSPFGLHFRH